MLTALAIATCPVACSPPPGGVDRRNGKLCAGDECYDPAEEQSETMIDRLKSAGFRPYTSTDNAGDNTAYSAYQRTFHDATDPLARREFGALIVDCGGQIMAPPDLTPGFSWNETGGQPYVGISAMQADLLQSVFNANVRPEFCGIVGIIHSHPFLDGFDQQDKDTFDNLKREPPASRIPWRLERSYLWAPQPNMGGNDPQGQPYRYP